MKRTVLAPQTLFFLIRTKIFSEEKVSSSNTQKCTHRFRGRKNKSQEKSSKHPKEVREDKKEVQQWRGYTRRLDEGVKRGRMKLSKQLRLKKKLTALQVY